MAQDLKETAHLHTDKKKFDENYDAIDWGSLREKPIDEELVKRTTKHVTAGLCGEYGMSTVDEEAFKENFDNIDWSKK